MLGCSAGIAGISWQRLRQGHSRTISWDLCKASCTVLHCFLCSVTNYKGVIFISPTKTQKLLKSLKPGLLKKITGNSDMNNFVVCKVFKQSQQGTIINMEAAVCVLEYVVVNELKCTKCSYMALPLSIFLS